MRINETISAHDVAEALKDDVGTFHAQRAGQNYLITAERGHSISSMRPVGCPELVLQNEQNPAFRITKLSDQVLSRQGSTEENERWRREQQREGAANRS